MEIEILQPEIFPKDQIISGVTTKNTQFKPNGLTFGRSEYVAEDVVKHNIKKLAEYLGVEDSEIKFLHQTHSDKIWLVDRNFQNAYGDALVTPQKGIILAVKIADCAGILLYDPKRKVVAAVHSGWRGSSKRILPQTIELMAKEFGTNPQDLLGYISPLASGERYEVGEEVAQLFPRSIHKNSDGKYFFDNRKELLLQFKETGVPSSNIEISEFCTIGTLSLHSYRREGKHSGRMAAFIGMR